MCSIWLYLKIKTFDGYSGEKKRSERTNKRANFSHSIDVCIVYHHFLMAIYSTIQPHNSSWPYISNDFNVGKEMYKKVISVCLRIYFNGHLGNRYVRSIDKQHAFSRPLINLLVIDRHLAVTGPTNTHV